MAVKPTGPGLTLLVVTVVLLFLCWLTVAARVLVRRKINAFGLDDWLMCAGLICFTITCAFIIICIYNGAGTRATHLNDYYLVQGRKWYVYAQVIYCLTTIPIKCSICVALLRIATRRVFRWALYSIMATTIVASFVIDVVILTWCRPIAASWGGAPGKCGPATTNANIGYFYSAVCILTDWALAILPALMLYDVQLKRRIKVSVAIILALGAFASTATIVRLRYLVLYNDPVDFLWGVAQIAVWSLIEEGTGIVAGSLAALRPLFKYIPFLRSSTAGSYGHSGATHGKSSKSAGWRYTTRSTASGGRSQHRKDSVRMHTLRSSSAAAMYDPERARAAAHGDGDGESQKHILKETEVVITTDEGGGGDTQRGYRDHYMA